MYGGCFGGTTGVGGTQGAGEGREGAVTEERRPGRGLGRLAAQTEGLKERDYGLGRL